MVVNGAKKILPEHEKQVGRAQKRLFKNAKKCLQKFLDKYKMLLHVLFYFQLAIIKEDFNKFFLFQVNIKDFFFEENSFSLRINIKDFFFFLEVDAPS